jgi:hypothetical protein
MEEREINIMSNVETRPHFVVKDTDKYGKFLMPG